ncbi:TPA: hypothetical protein ACIPU6_006094, partial [Escherichia coli]
VQECTASEMVLMKSTSMLTVALLVRFRGPVFNFLPLAYFSQIAIAWKQLREPEPVAIHRLFL